MKFSVFATGLKQSEIEEILKKFDTRATMGDYWNESKKKGDNPPVWTVGRHADASPSGTNYYIRLDGGRIIADRGAEIIGEILRNRRINHQKYRGVEVSKTDFMFVRKFSLFIYRQNIPKNTSRIIIGNADQKIIFFLCL